ncbi:MAG: tryptophan-rich sensory protein [Clostridia bacterium]
MNRIRRLADIGIVLLVTVLTMGMGYLFIDTGSWYHSLTKPSLPISAVSLGIGIGIVYAMSAVSAALVCSTDSPIGKKVLNLYGISGLLNVFWVYLFFYKQNLTAALLDILLLLFLAYLMIRVTRKTAVWSAVLFIPYGLWLLLILMFNYVIIMLN